jgi:hypothetical protein
LKTFLGGGLAPSSQTVGSLLIPLDGKAGCENDLSIAHNGFDYLWILTFSTFPISKSEISKFQTISKETEMLWQTFESAKSKTESYQNTSKLNKI